MTNVVELDDQLMQLANELNNALVEQLVSAGNLTTPAWREAFLAVSRHLFVPTFTLPQNVGTPALDVADPVRREEWLRATYINKPLLTELDEHTIPLSSCSAPSVVATMLELSQITEGQSVLEIGTGTGWTAGLLAHRLGSDIVTSVDVTQQYVTDARERLISLGLTPTLATWDGYQGYEPRAPYDRIMATASLRRVPPAWLGQVRPGGKILVDLRGSIAGNLALLTVHGDQSTDGQFLPETVNFMPLRSALQPFELLPELSSRAVNESGEQRMTNLEPVVFRKRNFAFFAQLSLPGTDAGQIGITGGATYFCVTDPHSEAWARVELGEPSAEPPVTQGGGRRLWDELEAAHELWEQLGQPQPEEFTISISPDGEQVVRLPGVERVWSLPL